MESMWLVLFGGGIGSVCRYWMSNTVAQWLGRSFPYGTLVVNALGSFLIGFLFAYLLNRTGSVSPALRALLIVGFLGGFTTFSSFSLETVGLLENGEFLRAVLNVGISVGLCLSLTILGIWIERQL